jgi:hypothetical protein
VTDVNGTKLLNHISGILADLREYRPNREDETYANGFFTGSIHHLSALEARIEKGEFNK